MADPKFDASIVQGSVSPRSFHMYNRDWNAYVTFAGDDALDSSAFARWREYMARKTTYSPSTINRMLTAVRTVMREAAAQKLITKELYGEFTFIRSVSERSLKGRKREHNRTKIAPEDMRRLCNAPHARTLLGIRDHALLLTMASSGARITEVATLTVDRVGCDKGGCYIMVNGKIDVEWRRAPLSKEAYEVIMRWLQLRGIESEYVFTSFEGRGGNRVSARCMSAVSGWRVVKKYADQIGLDHIKPHDFRRFVATQLVKTNPRQAQLALGHKNIASTYRYYVLDELENGVTDDLF
jgi:integrase/recombinase XerD